MTLKFLNFRLDIASDARMRYLAGSKMAELEIEFYMVNHGIGINDPRTWWKI